MAILKTVNNIFSCLAAYSPNTDILLSKIDPRNYTKRYKIDSLFQTPNDNTLYQENFIGKRILGDNTLQLVYLLDNGFFQVIAGVYGITGFRDGPGDQALFGIGGLQGSTYASAMDSKGVAYITDAKNSKIRKLVDPGNGGPWIVSTFASNIWVNSLYVDTQDRILTVNGNTILEYNQNGQISRQWANPAGSTTIVSISVLADGKLILLTRANAWDRFFLFDRDTNTATLLAGMTEAEVTAFQTANGYTPNDGSLIGEAAFHSPGLTYVASDLSEMQVGGGDVRGVRKLDFKTGRCSTLFVDGTWRETRIILTAPEPNTDPNRPYYVTQPSGRTANGYPRVSQYSWINTGTLRRIADVQLEGTLMNLGYLDSISTTGDVSGWVIIGTNATVNAIVDIYIDNVKVGSKTTDTDCQSCLDYFKSLGGGTATVTPRFTWPIPTQFKDGQTHKLKAIAAGYQLLSPTTGSPSEMQFTINSGSNNMGTINVVFQFGNFNAPTGTVVTGYKTELLDSSGAVMQTHNLPVTATNDSFTNVAEGNGYKVKMTTMNQAVVVGTPAFSNSVNVVSQTVTVQVILGGTATTA